MVMNPERFTEQAKEVIGTSQEIVRRYRHSQWDVEHVLLALLQQDQGVPADILRDLGVDPNAMGNRLDSILNDAPKMATESSQIYVAPRATNMLRRAEAEAQRLNDEFISTEHLLIAVVQEDQGDVKRLMAEFNVELESVYQALQGIRGGHRVTD